MNFDESQYSNKQLVNTNQIKAVKELYIGSTTNYINLLPKDILNVIINSIKYKEHQDCAVKRIEDINDYIYKFRGRQIFLMKFILSNSIRHIYVIKYEHCIKIVEYNNLKLLDNYVINFYSNSYGSSCRISKDKYTLNDCFEFKHMYITPLFKVQ